MSQHSRARGSGREREISSARFTDAAFHLHCTRETRSITREDVSLSRSYDALCVCVCVCPGVGGPSNVSRPVSKASVSMARSSLVLRTVPPVLDDCREFALTFRVFMS